jgi:diguanylate cyclase (GGDEF)-like protein
VLQSVAAVCNTAKRNSDVLARVGGEEFTLMLTETAEDAATQFAERLRYMVRDCSPTVEGKKLPVTVSIGVAGAVRP